MNGRKRLEPLQLFGWCVVAAGLYIWVPVLIGIESEAGGAPASLHETASNPDGRMPVVFSPAKLGPDAPPVQQTSLGQISFN